MLHYIIQNIAFQLFFLIIYDLFLKKETFFNWNRTYLLVTAMLSLVIPFIKISSFSNIISQDYIINLPEIFIGAAKHSEINPIELNPILIDNNAFWSWEVIFYIGVGVATLLFTLKLVKLLALLYKNPKLREGNLVIVSLLKSSMAFSFFNYIFLGEYLKKEEKAAVLKHERVHVEQKHTLDLLFFEVLRILFWFNPLVYMYQSRMMSLHEYIADAQAVKSQSKNQYYQNLLTQVFESKNISFINPFFKKSLIKKRIIMLQKSKSKQIYLVKYALIIPLVLGMLVYTSCEKQNNSVAQNEDLNKYTYSINLEEDISDEISEIQSKQFDFLKANPEYVLWSQFNEETRTIVSSVHSKAEKVPDGYTKTRSFFRDETEPIEFYSSGFGAIVGIEINGKDNPINDYLNEEVDVPFSVIEDVPVFPGCESLISNDERKKCMSKKISSHVNNNFNIELANELKLTGRQRISVIFKINKEGNVIDVRSRAPHLALEEEAIRVINLLPKMIPGKQKGKKVNVPYSLPIIFQVQE